MSVSTGNYARDIKQNMRQSENALRFEVQHAAAEVLAAPEVIASTTTVVILAKNEARSIGPLIELTQTITPHILVVDGHSHDGTPVIAESCGVEVIHDNRRGKGEAIRLSLDYVRTEITVFMDADLSHDPRDIPKLVTPILSGQSDHVSGSRLIGGSSELHGGFDECFRLMGSSLITACINWRFKVRLSESQNGFRAARTGMLKSLKLKENITTIEQEMIMKTLRNGYRMSEVPVHEYPRQFGNSNINVLKVGPRYVWCLLKNLL